MIDSILLKTNHEEVYLIGRDSSKSTNRLLDNENTHRKKPLNYKQLSKIKQHLI